MKTVFAPVVLLSFAAVAAPARYAAPHGEVVKIWPEGKMGRFPATTTPSATTGAER